MVLYCWDDDFMRNDVTHELLNDMLEKNRKIIFYGTIEDIEKLAVLPFAKNPLFEFMCERYIVPEDIKVGALALPSTHTLVAFSNESMSPVIEDSGQIYRGMIFTNDNIVPQFLYGIEFKTQFLEQVKPQY